MGGDDVPDAGLERGLGHHPALVGGQVPGGHDQLVARGQPEHLPGGRQRPAGLVEDVHHRHGDALGVQIPLQGQPHRRGGARGQVAVLGPVIGRVQGGHPEDPGALAGRDLDRDGVHPAHRGIQGQRPEHPDLAPQGLVEHRGAFGGRHVVRLERESGQAHVPAAAGQLEVGDPAAHHVRLHVHVQVIGAAHQPAAPLARLGRGQHGAVTRRSSRMGIGSPATHPLPAHACLALAPLTAGLPILATIFSTTWLP